MGMSQRDKVLANLDIPASAAVLAPAVDPGAVTNLTQMYMTNRLTFFEELVIAITQGYAANGKTIGAGTPAEFASSACALAQAIAYERDKYGAAS